MICDDCGTMYDGFVLVYNGVKIHRRQTQGQNICRNGSHFFFLEKSNCVNLLLQKQEKKRGFHFITGKSCTQPLIWVFGQEQHLCRYYWQKKI